MTATERQHPEDWPANYPEQNRLSYDALVDEYRQRREPDRKKDLVLIAPFVEFLRERFSGHKTRVLDVGCGAGLNVQMFAQAGFFPTGLDISQEMLHAVHEICPSATLLQGNLLSLQIPDESYEGVFAKAIIHLFPKPDALKALATMNRLLVERGIFYVTTTVEAEQFTGRRVKADYQGGIARYRRVWTEIELRDSVEQAGFSILKTTYNAEGDRGKRWFNIWAEKNNKK